MPDETGLSVDALRAALRDAEERLRQSELRYDTVMRASNEGVYDWDIEAGTIEYSARVQAAIGMTPEVNRTPQDWRGRIHPDDLPRYDAGLVAQFKGHSERFECDYRFRALDGSWRWTRQHGIALRDGRGRALRMIGSTGDITAFKRTEQALKEIEERYALATRVATEGIYEWDLPSGELYLSERAREFWGFPAGPLNNRHWVEHVHPQDRPRYRQAIIDHFKGRSPQLELELRVRNAAGEYRWVNDRGIAVRGSDGRATKLVGATSDTTQRKTAKQELWRAHEQTKAALEQQRATADVLASISGATTDAQPVFDRIVKNLRRLFGNRFTVLQLLCDGVVEMPAVDGDPGFERLRRHYPRVLDDSTIGGHAMLTMRTVQFAPVRGNPLAPAATQGFADEFGFDAVVFTPMVHEGRVIGAIGAAHPEPRPFDDAQIALLKTFADQAVIAIENVRLFKALHARTDELTRTVGQLTALHRVGQAISATLDLQTVLTTIVANAVQLAGLDAGVIYEYDERSQSFELRASQNFDDQSVAALRNDVIRRGEGAVGTSALTREPTQVPDSHADGYPPRLRELLGRAGFRALLAVPLLREDQVIGALTVIRRTPGPFATDMLELLKTFASQSALAIQNARLFREVEETGRRLEVATRHKSEFLANMSHELRTPLNAIIGFSEVLIERMFGELNPKQAEYLNDIHGSGRHLLSLINDILDLSKIEAGRMELELSEFDLPQAVEAAVALLKERAQRHAIALHVDVEPGLQTLRADERKFKQILLNLLSNAVKFTPDGGSVTVAARSCGEAIEVSVSDSGVGITEQDQKSLFEEFSQVGTDGARKAEGTGLGLALTRRFVELHGGIIAVRSSPGQGATFSFTLPMLP